MRWHIFERTGEEETPHSYERTVEPRHSDAFYFHRSNCKSGARSKENFEWHEENRAFSRNAVLRSTARYLYCFSCGGSHFEWDSLDV